MSLEVLIAEFKSRYETDPTNCKLPKECMERWIRESRRTRDQLLDDLAIRLANDFSLRKLDFDFCSTFTRSLKNHAFGDWPDLFWDIFIAFDAGEFGDRQDKQPSETRTRPMIEELLEKLRAKQ